MDRAINKSTGKLISALKIYKNGSYQNLNKGEWISPKDSIYNWEDLENKEEPVHYVKMGKVKYKNGKEGFMVKRNGQYGTFYACSNWNRGAGCKHIINIKEDENGEAI